MKKFLAGADGKSHFRSQGTNVTVQRFSLITCITFQMEHRLNLLTEKLVPVVKFIPDMSYAMERSKRQRACVASATELPTKCRQVRKVGSVVALFNLYLLNIMVFEVRLINAWSH